MAKDNTVEFFPHDKDMRHDPKVNALRIKFPGWGYTVWNMLLEIFSDSRTRSIEWNELNQELLAADFYIDKDMLMDIVDYAISVKLLQVCNGELMSVRFQERFQDLDEKREMKSLAGKKGANSRWKEKGSGMAENGEMIAKENLAITTYGNIKKSKEEKSKEKNISSSCSSSSSEAETTSPEKEEQEIISILFFKNFVDPVKEFHDHLIPWNNTGDRRWTDMSHEQRIAAAKLWKQNPERPKRFPERFLAMWSEIYNALHNIDADDEIINDSLSDRLSWKESASNYTLICSHEFYEFIEMRHMDIFKPIFMKYYGNKQGRVPLRYLPYKKRIQHDEAVDQVNTDRND